MATLGKISIALPLEMIPVVRGAVEAGEFASTSEVVRDALRDLTLKRTLRQQGVEEPRRVWQEALQDQTPRVASDDVFDRLEAKYRELALVAGGLSCCSVSTAISLALSASSSAAGIGPHFSFNCQPVPWQCPPQPAAA